MIAYQIYAIKRLKNMFFLVLSDLCFVLGGCVVVERLKVVEGAGAAAEEVPQEGGSGPEC